MRALAFSCETRLFGSLMLPKTMESVGHDRLAGGQNLAVADLAIFALGLDAGDVDALHAVGALLHDAAAAHRDVGVALQLEASAVFQS